MNETIEENKEDNSSYLTIYVIVECIALFGLFIAFSLDKTGASSALDGIVEIMTILAMLVLRVVLTIVALVGRYFFAKRSKSPAFKAQSKTVLRINLWITFFFFPFVLATFYFLSF